MTLPRPGLGACDAVVEWPTAGHRLAQRSTGGGGQGAGGAAQVVVAEATFGS